MSLTMMRLYFRMLRMPRLPLPNIGYTGILYSASRIDRHRYIYGEDSTKTTASPEFVGASGLLVKGGAMGAYNRRFYSTSTSDIKKAEKEREEKKKFKLKTEETIKIMLVAETGSLSAVTLEEANKIAKKRGMTLVHIENDREKPVKTEKEMYKLVSKAQLLENESDSPPDSSEKDSSNKQKELKTVLLKSTTGDHDTATKINLMKKWIKKGHRVRVLIGQSGERGDAEAVFKIIEEQMVEVEGQIQQKIKKGNELRFYVGPPKNKPAGNKQSKTTSKDKDSEAEIIDQSMDFKEKV